MDSFRTTEAQRGHIDALLIPLIVSILFLLGAIGFGAWAYLGRQDYKNNSDQKAAEAVEAAVEKTKAEDEAKFKEEEKYPLKSYTGPSQFGSVRIVYPKTWSGYVINRTRGNVPINWYLHPNVVPSAAAYALRVEVTSESYAKSVGRFENAVKDGTATVRPYKLPKVPDVLGSRIDGLIGKETEGSMVIMPLRNMTLKIWTESSERVDDFNKIVLPRVEFSP